MLHVRNRAHIDLRDPNALSTNFASEKISFCFFLACEVGGSKFIGSKDGNVQLDIVQNNVLIYQVREGGILRPFRLPLVARAFLVSPSHVRLRQLSLTFPPR